MQGALSGAILGAILLAIGVAHAILALAMGATVTADGLRDVLLAGLYLAVFALVGGIAGALSPVRRTWAGALLMGYVLAGVISTAGALVVLRSDHSHEIKIKGYVVIVGLLTVVWGTFAGYLFRKR